jgi:hypothetical protein
MCALLAACSALAQQPGKLPELGRDSYPALSRFEAPPTVRVSASRPQREATWDIHFVNYQRKEMAGKGGAGLITDENPVSVAGIRADLVSPDGFAIEKIEWMSPEAPELRSLPFERTGNRAGFTAPEFLVYAVARVHLAAATSSGTTTSGSVLPAPGRPPRADFTVSRANSVPGESCEPASCEHTHGVAAGEGSPR